MAFERPLLAGGAVVAGVDEVGRGALAGPLTVGVVVVSAASPPTGLDDSKRLTARQRDALEAPLVDWALDWALGSVGASEIDRWGLRLALAVAATRALDALTVMPTHVLVDGSFNLLTAPLAVPLGGDPPPSLRYENLAHTTIVKGDRQSAAISAAAVLAKVHRDRWMAELHDLHPEYDWASNKGYGSPQHLAALREHGPCAEHRRTWNLPGRTDAGDTKTGSSMGTVVFLGKE